MRILRDIYLSFITGTNLLFPCLARGAQICFIVGLTALFFRPESLEKAMSLGFGVGLTSEAISTQKKLEE